VADLRTTPTTPAWCRSGVDYEGRHEPLVDWELSPRALEVARAHHLAGEYGEGVTQGTGRREPRSTRYATARMRVALAGVGGIVAYGVAALLTPWQVAVLLGWDVMAASFLVWVWWTIRASDSEGTARLAKTEDPSQAVADLVLVSTCVASLPGVGFALVKASDAAGAAQAAITAVAVMTVALSWLLVHAVFTLRYADLYYAADGGIDFHDDRAPDYGDFAYVAFTIGMTYQVSDSDLISRPIRRTALRHALLSYLFGIAVIATAINAIASLLNH
jgi:uncharacterized membrane protein